MVWALAENKPLFLIIFMHTSITFKENPTIPQFTVVNIELVAGGREYEIHFLDKHMGPLIIYFDIMSLYVDHLVLYRGVKRLIAEKNK